MTQKKIDIEERKQIVIVNYSFSNLRRFKGIPTAEWALELSSDLSSNVMIEDIRQIHTGGIGFGSVETEGIRRRSRGGILRQKSK
jgi:hypothetical protein